MSLPRGKEPLTPLGKKYRKLNVAAEHNRLSWVPSPLVPAVRVRSRDAERQYNHIRKDVKTTEEEELKEQLRLQERIPASVRRAQEETRAKLKVDPSAPRKPAGMACTVEKPDPGQPVSVRDDLQPDGGTCTVTVHLCIGSGAQSSGYPSTEIVVNAADGNTVATVLNKILHSSAAFCANVFVPGANCKFYNGSGNLAAENDVTEQPINTLTRFGKLILYAQPQQVIVSVSLGGSGKQSICHEIPCASILVDAADTRTVTQILNARLHQDFGEAVLPSKATLKFYHEEKDVTDERMSTVTAGLLNKLFFYAHPQEVRDARPKRPTSVVLASRKPSSGKGRRHARPPNRFMDPTFSSLQQCIFLKADRAQDSELATSQSGSQASHDDQNGQTRRGRSTSAGFLCDEIGKQRKLVRSTSAGSLVRAHMRPTYLSWSLWLPEG